MEIKKPDSKGLSGGCVNRETFMGLVSVKRKAYTLLYRACSDYLTLEKGFFLKEARILLRGSVLERHLGKVPITDSVPFSLNKN